MENKRNLDYIKYSFLIILISLLTISCKQTESLSQNKALSDGKYDSGLNGNSFAKSIESISESVNKLDVIAFYNTWVFPKNSIFTKSFISNSSPQEYSVTNTINNESVSGTVITVYYKNSLAGFLTCAHIVDFPDSIFTYYNNDKKTVKSLSVKIRQQIFISDIPGGGSVEIVAIDFDKDLAFLKKEVEPQDRNIKPINLKVGSTTKLEWGSEIYVLGYPNGNFMLTKGIVSIDKSIKKRFLSDALYNKGISGSPVFAILDGIENIEWVGMASSASAQSVQYLSPRIENDELTPNKTSYYGDVFIEDKLLINYGITFSISIEEIITFIARTKSDIKSSGFDTNLLPTSD